MTSLLQKYITFNLKSKINFEPCELIVKNKLLVYIVLKKWISFNS